MFVVKLFATTAIALGDWSVDWGVDDETMREVVRPVVAPDAAAPGDLGLMRNGVRRAISFWKWLMEALAAGYQAGFLWVAAVGVYLLLRRDIDGVQTSEVYVDQDAEFGLPPLAEDAATGVPEVSTTEPARSGDIANPANLPRTD